MYVPITHSADESTINGNIIIETSLRELMQNWLEFIKEETLLQTNPRNMGECRDHIIFYQKPKGHPNLSNEVTEYF